MRRRMHDTFRILLTILLSMVVSLQTIPMRAVADELSVGTNVPDGVCDDVRTVADGDEAPQTDQIAVQEPQPGSDGSSSDTLPFNEPHEALEEGSSESSSLDTVDVPAEPTYVSGMLTEGFVDADGHRYTVTVTYDECAEIPSGAQLEVSTYDGRYESYGLNMDSCVKQALSLGERDAILGVSSLDARIVAYGQLVQPKNDVTVTIETDAIVPEEGFYTESVVVDEMAEEAGGGLAATKVTADARLCHMGSVFASGYGPSSTATETVRDNATAITLITPRLGTFSLVQVATRMDLWSGRGLDAWVWVPREGYAVDLRQVDAPRLEEGLDQLACYEMDVRSQDAGEGAFLVEALPSDATAGTDEGLGVSCYLADDARTVSDDPLFGPDGTDGMVPLDLAGRRMLFAWDTGYRNATVNMGNVTVEGMMPEGTDGIAKDVAERYVDPTMLVADTTQGLVAQSDGVDDTEFSTIAAFDISLVTDGIEYQPGIAHPLTVTIKDGSLREDMDVVVIHVADDGSTEAIDDFELKDGSVSFTTTGFSTYLVAQADEYQEGRSTTFLLWASGKSYARASDVKFVDTDRNPLYSTVTSTRYIEYTGSGKEKNEKNNIDMYEFADRLDPAIADEYEFSRVFVQLSGMEKDFRYVQVGDDTAIGQNDTTTQRAYFHMTSVDENASGKVYNGTWYTLNTNNRMNDIYIEFFHVAPASFKAIDTRGDPVVDAKFALFIDEDCYEPLEYKNEEVTAVSDEDGNVSFGKIPRGTYYMKETVIPEGYKKSIEIFTVVVDGSSKIADVVHEDDDGSIIISDILRMKLTKVWDDDEDLHANDSVMVTVHARGHDIGTYELNAANNWTRTIDGLDPNEPYMVSETLVTSNGRDVTSSWIPDITYEELDPHVEYYKTNQFRQDKEYVALTTTASGTRALVGNTSLTTVPLEANDVQITGPVTDDMVWYVETLTRDGVIALRNDASGSYLDQNGKWLLNSSYPDPLYVRILNDNGTIKFYHRANINAANAYYLYIWYQKGNKAEGTVDRYWNDANYAGSFDIYQKVNVRSVDVTIANRTTRYPIAVRSVEHPQGTPLPDVTFDLYTQEGFEAAGGRTPLMRSLRASSDGYLMNDKGTSLINLSAGTYYLSRTSDLESDGYAPLSPLRFTITRNGSLRVAREDQLLSGFAYSTTGTVDETDCPVLQVPAHKGATLELTLELAGDMADMTREFEFELAMPEGVQEVCATVAGTQATLTHDSPSFVLGHGQSIVLEEIPTGVPYVITQTSDRIAVNSAATEGMYVPEVTTTSEAGSTVTATPSAGDMRVVTLTDIAGSKDHPARVTITNRLEEFNAPPTGIDDNASVWALVVALCLVPIVVMRGRRVLRRW